MIVSGVLYAVYYILLVVVEPYKLLLKKVFELLMRNDVSRFIVEGLNMVVDVSTLNSVVAMLMGIYVSYVGVWSAIKIIRLIRGGG